MRADYGYDGIACAANAAMDLGVGRLSSLRHVVPGTPDIEVDHRSFQWDALGNKTQRKDLRSGGTQYTFDYTYDALSRLTESARVSGPALVYTLDAAGNRQTLNNDGTPEAYTLASSMNQYTQTPFDLEILHDELGNLSSTGKRAKVYTYDAQDRLTGYIIAAPRIIDDFSALDGYQTLLGIWAAMDESLKQTDAATAGGRILRTLEAGPKRFAFSYKTPHDPEDSGTYDPEYYALALLRVDQSAGPEWRYIALVIEPNRIALREWKDDALLQEAVLAEDTTVVTEANEWYEVEVTYGAADIEVRHAKRGNPFPEAPQLSLEGLTVTAGSKVGFGVGTGTDFAFDNLITTDTAVDLVQAAFKYDALGRRIARSEYLNGVHQHTTYFVYDGDRILEERAAATGAVEASYVYGNYVDEILQMRRGGEDYYYHTDDLFNVTAVTDSTGTPVERYAYDDYGAPAIYSGDGATLRTASAYGNPFLFQGRRWDETLQLYDYRTRYYDPALGRFLRIDTIGLWGDGNNLGNPYAFVGNNPWSRVDPFGQFGAAPGVSEYYLSNTSEPLLIFDLEDPVGQLRDSAQVAKGYFISAPVGIVTGAVDTALHFWQIPGALWHAATHWRETADSVSSAIEAKASTFEGQGEIAFDAAISVLGPGAGTVKLAPKVGRLAHAGNEAANAVKAGALSRFTLKITPWQRRVYQRADIDWEFVRPEGSVLAGQANRVAARQSYSPWRINPRTGKADDVVLRHTLYNPRGAVNETW